MWSRWCLFAVLFSLCAMTNAWARELPVSIKVISEKTYQVQGPPLVPVNCNWPDYSAYCNNSRPRTYTENTMVVQEPDGKSLEVECTVYARWAHCPTLPVNQSYEARMKKNGVEISYLDQHGKMREQFYEIVRENSWASTPASQSSAIPH